MAELCFDLIRKTLPEKTANIFIAYSGGVDSHVLLHLCAQKPLVKDKITAVYIHHGLQQEADCWQDHCQTTARDLGVDFCSFHVNANPQMGQSPEEAARNARYDALKNLLDENDVLLVAQHREDQLETVLLQLFRGAGVKGLAAMPVSASFGRGLMLRPLLSTAKKSIDQYAQNHTLHWVEDPSNQAIDYDRNFLRNQVIPLLKGRWPAIDKTVSRSAMHCASADELLQNMADELLDEMDGKDNRLLNIEPLMALTENKRNLLLRRWFELHGLKSPTLSCLQAIIKEVMGARMGADPQVMVQGYLIKRYQGKLYCIDAKTLMKEDVQAWTKSARSLRRANGYRLDIVESVSGIPIRLWNKSAVTVKLRAGGEVIKLPRRDGQHKLKKLFQEAGVPPWQREIVPLIYLDDRLAAVAGLWVSEEFYSAQAEPCYEILWNSTE
jgi:tRNA(Ile)-lysidine synthase